MIAFSAFQLSDKSDIRTDKKRRLKGKRKYETAFGVQELLDAICSFVNKPELTEQLKDYVAKKSQKPSKNNKDSEAQHAEKKEKEKEEQEDKSDDEEQEKLEHPSEELTKKAKHSFVIGTVGHPNVGKSSLINGIVGRKVVSTSRTPGNVLTFSKVLKTNVLKVTRSTGRRFH